MASLLVAASLLIHNKVHDKREAKRERKRLVYEARYRELEDEHARHQHEVKTQRSMSSGESRPMDPRAEDSSRGHPRRHSEEQPRGLEDDNPAKWVDDIVRQRSKESSA